MNDPHIKAGPAPMLHDEESDCAQNTDRELWREREGDYYADSIHVTEGGGIGINAGGLVVVKPLRAWMELAKKEILSENPNAFLPPPDKQDSVPSAPLPEEQQETEQDLGNSTPLTAKKSEREGQFNLSVVLDEIAERPITGLSPFEIREQLRRDKTALVRALRHAHCYLILIKHGSQRHGESASLVIDELAKLLSSEQTGTAADSVPSASNAITPPSNPKPSLEEKVSKFLDKHLPLASKEGEWTERDKDWILAIADALGMDSGFHIPIVPQPEPFRKLFAEIRATLSASSKDSVRLDWLEDRYEVSVTDDGKVRFECGRLYSGSIREAIDDAMSASKPKELGEPGG